jgi:hypothetical protein
MPVPKCNTSVYVGCASSASGSLIKIGSSGDVQRRGGELDVIILWTTPGGELLERRLQRQWKMHRINHGEWFWPHPRLLLWITCKMIDAEASRRQLAALATLIRNVMRGRAAA